MLKNFFRKKIILKDGTIDNFLKTRKLKKDLEKKKKQKQITEKKRALQIKKINQRILQTDPQLTKYKNYIHSLTNLKLEELKKEEEKILKDLMNIFQKKGLPGIEMVEEDWQNYRKKYIEQFYEKITKNNPNFKKPNKELQKYCQQYLDRRLEIAINEIKRISK